MGDTLTTQLLLLLLLKRRVAQRHCPKERKARRWRVRPVNLKREKTGEFKRIMLELKLHDEEWFFTYTRMTPAVFDNLLNIVDPSIAKTSIRKTISPSQRLLITLRFLATGDSYFSIAQSYCIGKSTVCVIVKEVAYLIWQLLQPLVMPEPNETVFRRIANEYTNVWNVPNCIGSIDGKNIRVTAPAKSGSLYYNYKGYFSIVLLGICDAQYNFTCIDVGAYGSVSDGGVFSSSNFGRRLQSNSLPIPMEVALPGTDTRMGHFFVGDAAFPLSKNLMRPFSGNKLNLLQAVYNYRISRARRVIENTFDILVARWRIFHRAICASPENVENIITDTICLHNFIKSFQPAKEHYCPNNVIDDDDVLGKWRQEVEGTILNGCGRLGSNNAAYIATNMRNTLANYFLTPAGLKKGQIEYVKRT